MGCLKTIQLKKSAYNLLSLLLMGWISLCSIELQAQLNYDIRLVQSSIDLESKQVCFEVQLKSATSESWELAGQNYRLYYDSGNASFIAGKSLLGSKYQSFKLVQDEQNIDGSAIDGELDFESNLGFLNYAIDLVDVTSPAKQLPADSTWLSTTEICFQLEDLSDEDNFNFSLVWARHNQTGVYATSFLEISMRLETNELIALTGNDFQDWYSSSEVSQGVAIQAKAFLQGAFDYNTKLMRDKLRTLNYLPLESVYHTESFSDHIAFRPINQKKEILSTNNVFQTGGENAIVDWVFLELRDKEEVGKVVATRSALIQKDGDIVDLDGKNPVKFSVASDAYYFVIRHRNHLGIMSKTPIALTGSTSFVDFTDPQTPTYGKYAQKVDNGIALMWGGNADNNEYLIFQGGGIAIPDDGYVFFEVFENQSNIHNRYNHIVHGYFSSDLNMDGEIRYQGGANEIDDLLFFNIFLHPENIHFFSNFFIQEQVPPRIE